jgi:hypothetical protein
MFFPGRSRHSIKTSLTGNAVADFLIATTQLVYRLAVGAGFSNPLSFAGAFGWAVNEKRPASENKLAMANDIRETNPLRRCRQGGPTGRTYGQIRILPGREDLQEDSDPPRQGGPTGRTYIQAASPAIGSSDPTHKIESRLSSLTSFLLLLGVTSYPWLTNLRC